MLVECGRDSRLVTVWTEEVAGGGASAPRRGLRVFRAGWPIEAPAIWVGSCQAHGGALHVYADRPGDANMVPSP